MSTPQVNTKIERLTEAIEDMAVAVKSGFFDNVQHARQELSESLREFTTPVLRVAGGTDTKQ